MTLKDLTRDEIEQLKQNYLCSHFENVSYEELANADELVSDEQIEKEYSNFEFVADDFF